MSEETDTARNFREIIMFCKEAKQQDGLTFEQALEAMRLAIEMRPR